MKWLRASVYTILTAALLWASGIIPAIIPQAVPLANKIGNSTKFQLGSTGAVSGDCASFDASLNITGPGTGAGCGGGGASGALVLLESHTASNSTALAFTTRNAAGQQFAPPRPVNTSPECESQAGQWARRASRADLAHG